MLGRSIKDSFTPVNSAAPAAINARVKLRIVTPFEYSMKLRLIQTGEKNPKLRPVLPWSTVGVYVGCNFPEVLK